MITQDEQTAIEVLAGAIGDDMDTARNMVGLARYVDSRGHGVDVVTTFEGDEVSVGAIGPDLIVESRERELFPVVCPNGCPEGYLGDHKMSCREARAAQ